MPGTKGPKTAFGEWVDSQPRGALSDAQRETGLAWSTVCRACHALVTPDVAKLLSRFTRGAVSRASLEKPPRKRAKHATGRAA